MMGTALALCVLTLLHSSSSIPLSDFYPFGFSEGDSIVDDYYYYGGGGDSNFFVLNQSFPLFNSSYPGLYVNHNGVISFVYDHYYSYPYIPSGEPLIAPFWTYSYYYNYYYYYNNPNSTVWYGERSDDMFLLDRAQQEVRRYFASQKNFVPNFLFVATWDQVPQRYDLSKNNTYQCVLVSDGLQSFVFFHYADGMISGDINRVEVGYDAGDYISYYNVPGSRTADIVNITRTSNVGIGGIWAFRLDEEENPVITCSDTTSATVKPRRGNMLGGTGVFIHVCQGIRVDESVKCFFGTTSVDGRRLGNTLAVCVSPPVQKTGYILLEVVIGDGIILKSQFLSLSPESSHSAIISGHNGLLFDPEDEVTIKWSPELIMAPAIDANVTVMPVEFVDINVFIQFYRFDTGGYDLHLTQEINNVENDGEEIIKVRGNPYLKCTSVDDGVLFKVCSILFKITVNDSHVLPKEMGIWSGIAFLKPNASTSDEELAEECEEWSESFRNRGLVALLDTLPPCPPTMALAIFDITYQREDMISQVTQDQEYHKIFMSYFHPNIKVCYRQSIPLGNGPGQQCCYGADNSLKKKYAGGSADVESPLKSYYRHVVDDLLPYILCCKGDYNICDKYYSARPVSNEAGYILPIPACIYGDPHIVTLDGHKYTFNGKGEFILIQTSNNVFALQGRMEQAIDPEGTPSPGTVFTAIVAKQVSSNTSVQFEVDPNEDTLLVMVDGMSETFDGISILEFEDVILLDKGNSTVQALFSSGANVKISVLNGIINVMLVALPSSMKQTTSGLMGSFNDIISDDLKPRNGGDALLLDDTLENIHYKFGITWIISNESESLFTYKPGESWSSYYSPDFIPMFAPTFTDTTLQEEAKEVCGDDSFCLFDIAATKRVEIGAATMEGQEMLETIVEMSKPITCSPVCENGVCLENNTCRCSDGYQGDRCSEPVLEECGFNPCQNNGTCSKLSLTHLCECPPQFVGSFCQNKVPPFRIRMLNGSPRVIGNSVQIEFSPTKTAVSRCTIDGRTQDCSHGIIRYNNITSGLHILRIISFTKNKERAVLRRRIYMGPCSVHLINDGITVNDGDVTIEFTGTSDVSVIHCKLDNSKINTNCKSPLRYKSLDPGQHKVVLRPRKCAKKGQGSFSVKFDI